MSRETETLHAARRLLKSQLRRSLFASKLGEDSGAVFVEEGIKEKSQEEWYKALSSWDLSLSRSQILNLIQEAFELAQRETRDTFDDVVSEDCWHNAIGPFSKEFQPTDLLPKS